METTPKPKIINWIQFWIFFLLVEEKKKKKTNKLFQLFFCLHFYFAFKIESVKFQYPGVQGYASGGSGIAQSSIHSSLEALLF